MGQRAGNALARIEARQRVLKHHLDRCTLASRVQCTAIERHVSLIGPFETDGDAAQRRFPRPRLADQADDIAENATSADVKGVPSDQLTPSRRLTVKDNPSSEACQL